MNNGSERRKGIHRAVTLLVFAGSSLVLGIIAIAVFWGAYEQTSKNFWIAAAVTAMVLIVLGVIAQMVWEMYRKKVVENPSQDIILACDKMSRGDFHISLKTMHDWGYYDELDQVKIYLMKMADELSKNEILKSDFIADVSHEIRTNLSVISAYTNSLMVPNISPAERENSLKVLSSTCMKLSVMVSNILKLNKLENMKIVPKINVFNLSESLTQCTLQAADKMDEKGIELDCDIPDRVMVKSDKDLLEIIWNNLLSNAIKFTDKGGKITVRLFKSGDRIVVSVKDTGCGMSAQTGKRIFEKFYQGDTSHKEEGNGLGLSLVKRVIDMLGGDIKVESTLGKGSTFMVSLLDER